MVSIRDWVGFHMMLFLFSCTAGGDREGEYKVAGQVFFFLSSYRKYITELEQLCVMAAGDGVLWAEAV